MLAPRVLLILNEQWPRALLRAELRERGYDAQGAPSVEEALVYPVEEPGRGRVRLIVLDRKSAGGNAAEVLGRLRTLHAGPPVLLLDDAEGGSPEGPWAVVVRRPFRMGDVLRAVQQLLPLRNANVPEGGRDAT